MKFRNVLKVTWRQHDKVQNVYQTREDQNEKDNIEIDAGCACRRYGFTKRLFLEDMLPTSLMFLKNGDNGSTFSVPKRSLLNKLATMPEPLTDPT